MQRTAFLFWLVGALLYGCGGGGGGGGAGTPTPSPSPDPGGQPDPAPDPVALVPPVDPSERFSGGAAGTASTNERAFGQVPPAVASDFELDANFKSGNSLFRGVQDGVGPLLNARTCQGCHTRDGRGALPQLPDVPLDTMSIRLSTGIDDGAVIPDDMYGAVLHTFGLDSFGGDGIEAGLSAFGEGSGSAIGEGFATIEYETVVDSFADGVTYELRRPIYKVRELSYGDFDSGILFSPRLAPSVFGSGLLEVIPEAEIRELADPEDADGDGISGRAATVFDQTVGTQRLGRFGLKASVASLLQQTALAYRNDSGATSRYVTDEACGSQQISCQQAALAEPNEAVGGVDIADIELALVELYVRLLAVPDRRGFDEEAQAFAPEILAGRIHFFEAGCGGCHRYSFTTGEAEGSVLGDVSLSTLMQPASPISVLSEQQIFPYTDLLLHDMGGACPPISQEFEDGTPCGSGQNCTWVQRCTGLADGRPEGDATGTEWRTPPLWGIGLVTTVNPNATFLHDGRARTIEEAVLWHGGEASAARAAYKSLDLQGRDELLAFLESL